MKNIKLYGHDCVIIDNNQLQLCIGRSIGPRILGINFYGGRNLFAELPNFVTELPGGRPYHFYGGHRLWIAPEEIPLTYDYDDQPIVITETKTGVIIKKPKEFLSGIEKTLTIQMDPVQPKVIIEHKLMNLGQKAVECAAWAITQFKPGGVAILPQSRIDTGLLPNRSLAIWPYTNLDDPNLKWGNDYVLLNANVKSPFKIGFPNPRGWLAYWLDDCLFVKHAPFDPEANYYDMGSSSECYCNDQFLELETISPKTIIKPGEFLTHTEIWELFRFEIKPDNETNIIHMLQKLGIK